jgi:hypothetical protein
MKPPPTGLAVRVGGFGVPGGMVAHYEHGFSISRATVAPVMRVEHRADR